MNSKNNDFLGKDLIRSFFSLTLKISVNYFNPLYYCLILNRLTVIVNCRYQLDWIKEYLAKALFLDVPVRVSSEEMSVQIFLD